MEMDIKTEEVKEIVLADNSWFSYTIKQVEITNVLGAAIGVLDEYFITNSAGENYKLYKTKEGNWYDMGETKATENIIILRALKLTIDLL
jgi:predicted proteasome-type protease